MRLSEYACQSLTAYCRRSVRANGRRGAQRTDAVARANLLVAADCTAFAYGNFHRDFIRNHITLVGCPKLDEGDYAEKLTQIIANNNLKSVTVVRMEVPCCGGIENAVKRALQASGKYLPWRVVTISTDGRILE